MKTTDRPALIHNVDIRKLDISPELGYLLSRVDGATTIEELALISGNKSDAVMEQVKHLVDKGILELKATLTKEDKAKANKFHNAVNDMYDKINQVNHYNLLGIRRKASADEIKSAFIKATKEYHPDKLFRNEDKELRIRLQTIFARINEAYKTLSNEDKRLEYDNNLDEYEDVYEEVEEEAASSKDEAGTADKKETETKPKLVLKKKKILKPKPKNPFTDQIMKAKKIFEMGLHEVKKRNYSSAKTNIRLAMQLDPYNTNYPKELEKIQQMENKYTAQQTFQEAQILEKDGNTKKAIAAFKTAIQLDKDEPKYLVGLAKALVKDGKKMFEAKPLLIKAIEMKANVAEAHYLLGQVYVNSDLKTVAIQEFEKALNLDPKNKEISKALKKARKM